MIHLDRIARNVKSATGDIDTREWAREMVETMDGMDNKMADIEKMLRKTQDSLEDIPSVAVVSASTANSGEIVELARTTVEKIDKWEPGPELQNQRQQTIRLIDQQTSQYEQQLDQQHREFRQRHTERLTRIFKDQLS